jgi:hypothetical protein
MRAKAAWRFASRRSPKRIRLIKIPLVAREQHTVTMAIKGAGN